MLVPGGEFTIGFDTDQWEPTEEALASWEDTAEEYQLDPAPIVHLRRVMNQVRLIRMPTMLVETTGREVGWSRIPTSDPCVQNLLKEHSYAGTIISHNGDQVIRVKLLDDGRIVADAQVGATHSDVVKLLGSNGFRLPSSDEWEYLCGTGTTTLFRWRDHAPCDRYPTDVSPEEAAWRRQWVMSAGTLERPSAGFKSDWEHHRVPNALGLTIAKNPYETELVDEPDVVRGGDGGCTICGGVGFFAGWLPLASAYFEEDFCQRSPDDPVDPSFMFVRRVFQIA